MYVGKHHFAIYYTQKNREKRKIVFNFAGRISLPHGLQKIPYFIFIDL